MTHPDLERFKISQSFVKGEYGRLTNQSVVTALCECGAEVQIKIASLLRTIKRVGKYRCLSCGVKEKSLDPGYLASISAGVRKSWSDDRCSQQSDISKNLWANDLFRKKITESSTKTWSNPQIRNEASIRTTELWKTEEFRDNQKVDQNERDARSERAKSMWLDPEYVKRQLDVKASDKHVELQRTLAIERWNNDEYRSSVIDSIALFWKGNDVAIKEASDRAKSFLEDPEYREKIKKANEDPDLLRLKSDNATRQWADPKSRKCLLDGLHKAFLNPAYREAISVASKARWQDDEYRKRQAVARSEILSNGKDSILERTTQTLLDALNIKYIRHHVLGYFEFDLFIPSHNLLIECNGEYWHSLRKSADASKFTYIDKYFSDLKIMYLWERDFLNPGLIRQKLVRALFNEEEDNQNDFSFDDIVIEKIDIRNILPNSYYSPPEEFLQSFHYSGYGRAAKSVYGAYFGNNLIAVCKFCPPVRKESATSMGFSQSQVLELDRFCIHPSYQKKNFASWMISRCSKKVFANYPGVLTLISFSDSTFGHTGTIYLASNWEEMHIVPSDYHYINQDGFVIHKKTLYGHASRHGSTESEYASEHGYVKIFGKEKKKFCFRRPVDS
jgi:hypothetical protein